MPCFTFRIVASILLLLALGSTAWARDTHFALGVSVLDATIPGGHVRDAVHTGTVADADMRPGVSLEVARSLTTSGAWRTELEGSLLWHTAESTGATYRGTPVSATGNLFALILFGNGWYQLGKAEVGAGLGLGYLFSSWDRQAVYDIELDAEGGGAKELALGAQAGLRFNIGNASLLSYRVRTLGASKHDAGVQHLLSFGWRF